MTPDRESGADIARELLQHAIPLNPSSGDGDYVRRGEFTATISSLKSEIVAETLKTKNWILGAAIAVILSVGGTFMLMSGKIDRVNEALPTITARQNTRWPWVQQLQQRELLQDQALKKLDKTYQPLPYEAPPQ